MTYHTLQSSTLLTELSRDLTSTYACTVVVTSLKQCSYVRIPLTYERYISMIHFKYHNRTLELLMECCVITEQV